MKKTKYVHLNIDAFGLNEIEFFSDYYVVNFSFIIKKKEFPVGIQNSRRENPNLILFSEIYKIFCFLLKYRFFGLKNICFIFIIIMILSY